MPLFEVAVPTLVWITRRIEAADYDEADDKARELKAEMRPQACIGNMVTAPRGATISVGETNWDLLDVFGGT